MGKNQDANVQIVEDSEVKETLEDLGLHEVGKKEIRKEELTETEQMIINIIRQESKDINYGLLTIGLLIREGKLVRVEATSSKKEYKI